MIQRAHITAIQGALIFVALLIICPAGIFAQRLWLVGGTGYEFGFSFSNDETMEPSYPAIPETDKDLRHKGWAGLGLISSDLVARDVGVDLWLNFVYGNRTVAGTLGGGVFIVPSDDSIKLVRYAAVYDSKLWTTALQLDLKARLRIIDELHLESGLLLGYRLGSGFSQTIRITEPEGVTFSDGRRELVLQDGSSLDNSPFGTSVMVGLSYDIPMSGIVGIRPGTRMQTSLGNNLGSEPAMFALGLWLYFRNPDNSRTATDGK